MLKKRISQNLVNLFPVAGDQALLVQVDKIAFDLFSARLVLVLVDTAILEIVSDLVAVDLLQGVAKGLQLLKLALAEKFFNYLGQKVDVAVRVVKLMLLAS